uniref:Uncharacterized protein n=1 Tax=Setaria viridis TaxID=4556 RepID=A0A4U6VKU4_SETVI|nr:hypothetical protein SEVIR_3G393700v2 [Setaria viridis]
MLIYLIRFAFGIKNIDKYSDWNQYIASWVTCIPNSNMHLKATVLCTKLRKIINAVKDASDVEMHRSMMFNMHRSVRHSYCFNHGQQAVSPQLSWWAKFQIKVTSCKDVCLLRTFS